MATCPNKNYTYIQTSNFGDKKKVTEELLRAFCGNDAYLKRKVEELEDLSDPESKKRFQPPYNIDQAKSFGVVSGTKDGQQIYSFNNNTSKAKIIDFNTNNDDHTLYDDSLIDYESTNCEIYNDGTDSGARIKLEKATKIVPKNVQIIHQNTVTADNESLDAYDYGSKGGILNIEGHWYVGFRKTKSYNVKPEWWLNPLSYDIPAVSRAQSFKAMKTGLLTSVNLAIAADTTTIGDIYVEIRPMTEDNIPSTTILARATQKFSGSGAGKVMLKNFRFDNAAKVEAGKKYAIVVRSSLGSHSQTYHLCGWDRRVKGEVYTRNHNGYAYVSYNNGKSWLRHTHESSKQLGLNHADTPLAFGFEVFIKETRLVTTVEEKTEYNVEEYTYYPTGSHQCYLKVPIDNPISSITIAASTTTPTNTDVKFYISQDNRNWVQNGTSSGEGLYDETTCPAIFAENDKPTFLFIKSDLITSDVRATPILKDVTVTMTLIAAKKGYLRTLPYKPLRDTMLPASIWSEIDAEIENDYSNVNVDLIRDTEQEELFKLVYPTVAELQDLILDYDPDASFFDVDTDAEIKTYCTDHTEFVEYLKTLQTPIYILGDNDDNEPFFESFELYDYPAYPLCCVQAMNEDISQEDGDNDSWSYSNGVATYTLPFDLKDQLLEVNLTRKTNNTTETIILYEGTLGTKVDAENSRYADFHYDKTNKKLEFDLTNSTLFKSYCNIENNKIIGFRDSIDASKIYELKICGLNTKYTEWLDYTVDYDNKKITWEENALNLIEGMLRITYNPLFARNLQPTDFPVKLDLWTETVEITEPTTIHVLKGYAIDSLRLVAVDYNTENEVILVEGTDFTVDYQTKTITFNDTLLADHVLTVKYTPALTDNSLSVAVRMDRESTDQDCYIVGNSFTTRT